MTAPPAGPDAELVTRAAGGEQAAYMGLLERHVDRVHDHVARWSRDAALAAEATRTAFVELLHDLGELPHGEPVLPRLLRVAREVAVEQLRRAGDGTTGPDTRVPMAVLAATAPDPATSSAATTSTHAASQLVWEVAAGLDERAFTLLDLHVRQGLAAPAIAAVTGTPVSDADVQRMRDEVGTLFAAAQLLRAPTQDCAALERLRPSGTSPPGLGAARRVRDHAEGCVTCGPRRARVLPPLRSYAALAPVRAPLAVRSGVAAAAAQHFGTVVASGTRVRRGVVGAVLVGLLLLVGGVATAMRHSPQPSVDGPPSVAAEPLPPPSPSPEPTPTLDVLPSPTGTPSPDPVVEVDPSPSPSPRPDASPSPTALTVTISAPALGASTLADRVEEATGRDVGVITVAADVRGGGEQVTVAWRSRRDPGSVLLQGSTGQVQLWLTTACEDTQHALEATATDAATGETDTAAVDVLVEHTCATAVQVTVQQPAEGARVEATEDSGRTAVIEVAASANDDGLDWRWTSPQASDGPLLEAASGQVRLTAEGCDPVDHTLTATAQRGTDGSTASHSITVTVLPTCPT